MVIFEPKINFFELVSKSVYLIFVKLSLMPGIKKWLKVTVLYSYYTQNGEMCHFWVWNQCIWSWFACAEGLKPPILKTAAPIWQFPLLYLFSEPPMFCQHFFDNITPMKYEINTKINSLGKVILSCLEHYKTKLCAFC